MSKDTHNTTVNCMATIHSIHTQHTRIVHGCRAKPDTDTSGGRNWTSYLLCVGRADNLSIKWGFEGKFKELNRSWVKQEQQKQNRIAVYLGAVQ